MKVSIAAELKAHILGMVNDGILTDDNQEEWHQLAFNTSYYIIGYYQASVWLKQHDVDAFEAINHVLQYEEDNFGEVYTAINPESIVNMLVYILGEELLAGINTFEELEAL